MNALDLIAEAAAAGVKIEMEDDGQLYADGPATAELMERLRARRPELRAALLAQRYGIGLHELAAAAGTDWPEVLADPELLDATARAVEARRMREAGRVPPHYTATTRCAHCGPVPIFPGAPATVAACPWCANRITGRPMPRAAT